tara:strand:- start:517 stop:3237 length:2721 start_codon:yes stop_codon:yes gene_type:complete
MAANLILPAGSAAASGGGDSTPAEDPVTRSLRFNNGDASGLYFDPTSTHDSSTVYTFSCWAKLGKFSEGFEIFTAGYYASSGSSQDLMYFGHNADSKLRVWLRSTTDSTNVSYTSTAVFRDPSAWYHILLARNGASLKVYVNNTEVISETISSTQRYGVGNGYPMHVGVSVKPTSSQVAYHLSFDGLLADVYFTDGYAKAPTDFIELGNYGNYVPKAYTGSFGTNGFHIDAQPAHDADLLVSSIDRNDGDTTFADAAKGHGLTVSGDTKHSIAVGNPFTGDDRAIYFDGTDDYLTVDDGANIDLGTGNFTIEFWMNSDEDASGQYITGRWNATPNVGSYSNREWGITLTDYNQYGLNIYATSANYATINICDSKWHHVAIVRSSGDAKLYIDGEYVLDATVLDSLNMSFSSHLIIGGGQNTCWRGAIYDYRISDTVRYSSNFDVPTEKFTSDSNTLLLIQPDKDDTTFHDESDTSTNPVTTVSAPTRTASTPYDAAAKSTAMYFDGNGDCLTTSTSTDLAVASGDSFTAECWVYINNQSDNTYDGIFSGYSSGTGWALEIESGYWGVYDSGAGAHQQSSTAATTGEWHHVALVKTDNSTDGARLYLDGNKIDDVTVSSNHTSARPVNLGAYHSDTSAPDGSNTYSLDGYIFDARFTKGEEKYTGSTYTVPSAPFELNPVYLGGDQSGNKNHFTPTNISSHDTVLDTPTRNYATWNPLTESGATYSEGNTKINCNFDSVNGRRATVEVSSGKWYWEVLRLDGAGNVGVFDCSNNTASYYAGWHSSDYGITVLTAGFRRLGSTTSTSNTTGNGDIVQFALDVDAGKLWIGKNGTWFESGDPSAGTNAIYDSDISGRTWSPTVGQNYSATSNFVLNAGADPTFAGNKTSGQDTTQDEFYYAPPTGFSGL